MSEEGHTEVYNFMRRDYVSTCSNSRVSSKEPAAFILYPKDACSRFLWNVDKCETHDNVPHLSRLQYLHSQDHDNLKSRKETVN